MFGIDLNKSFTFVKTPLESGVRMSLQLGKRGANKGEGAKHLNKKGKSIFVCPFCTVFTESTGELVSHFEDEHPEAALRAYAEQQRVPKRTPVLQECSLTPLAED